MSATLTGSIRFINQIIASKGFLPVQAAGTQFYLTAASGPLFIKADAGSYALYYSAMGNTVDDGFSGLSIYNPTPYPITFSMLVSFSDVIDKRQLPTTEPMNVIKMATFVDGGPGGLANLPDVSGQQFTDPAGAAWLAIQRVSVWMQCSGVAAQPNTVYAEFYAGLEADGDVLFVQQGPVANTSTPPPPIILQTSGDLSCFVNPTLVAAEKGVSLFEIYQAIQPNSLAYQPPN